MSEEKPQKEHCPSTSGTTVGYKVEVADKHGHWDELDTHQVLDGFGVKRAHYSVGIFDSVDLFGYEAAMALAWMYKANRSLGMFGRVRVVPYRMEYDIKARRASDGEELSSRPTLAPPEEGEA